MKSTRLLYSLRRCLLSLILICVPVQALCLTMVHMNMNGGFSSDVIEEQPDADDTVDVDVIEDESQQSSKPQTDIDIINAHDDTVTANTMHYQQHEQQHDDEDETRDDVAETETGDTVTKNVGTEEQLPVVIQQQDEQYGDNSNTTDSFLPWSLLQQALRQVVENHVLDGHPSIAADAMDQPPPLRTGTQEQRHQEEQEQQQQQYTGNHGQKTTQPPLSQINLADILVNVDLDHLTEEAQIRLLLQQFLADKNNNNKPSRHATQPATNSKRHQHQQHQHQQLQQDPYNTVSSLLFMDEDYDDRTLLDIFGESAKEYLTQRMIPDTDIECRWDWRSIRCEPACQCHLDLKLGDYHLGRSCRFRPHDDIDDSNNHNNNTCIDIHPAMFLREAPIPKRIISLSTQTLDILKLESQQAVQTVRREFNVQLRKLQKHVCHDIWELRKEAIQQQQQQQQQQQGKDGIFYLPPPIRRQVPTRHSIAEKLVCGQEMDHVNVVRDDCDSDNEQ